MSTLSSLEQSQVVMVGAPVPASLLRLTLIQILFILSLGYHLILMMLKTAFILQYRRSFPLPSFQRLCDVFLIFIAFWTIAGAVAGGATCTPGATAAGLADLRVHGEPRCRTGYRVWLAHGILNIATDILIYAMPLPMIRTLPLSRGQKFGLGAAFSLGFVQVFRPVASSQRASLTELQHLCLLGIPPDDPARCHRESRPELQHGQDRLLVTGGIGERYCMLVHPHAAPAAALYKRAIDKGTTAKRQHRRTDYMRKNNFRFGKINADWV